MRDEVITEQRRRGGSGSRYDRFRQRFMSRPELIKVQQQMNTVEEHAEGKPYIIHPDPPPETQPSNSDLLLLLLLDFGPSTSFLCQVFCLLPDKKKKEKSTSGYVQKTHCQTLPGVIP